MNWHIYIEWTGYGRDWIWSNRLTGSGVGYIGLRASLCYQLSRVQAADCTAFVPQRCNRLSIWCALSATRQPNCALMLFVRLLLYSYLVVRKLQAKSTWFNYFFFKFRRKRIFEIEIHPTGYQAWFRHFVCVCLYRVSLLPEAPKLLFMYTVEQRGFLVRNYRQTGSFKACQTAFRTEFGERRAPSKCCVQKLVKKFRDKGKPI